MPTNCPFCGWQSQTILEATANFVLIADKFPLVEGHTLVIPKAHSRCLGETPADRQAELVRLVTYAQQKLARLYGRIGAWENGGIRQSVRHAHLHLLPLPGDRTLEFGARMWESGRIVPLENWEGLFEWHAANGFYQLFQIGVDAPPHVLKPATGDKRYNEVGWARLNQVGVWSVLRSRLLKYRNPQMRQKLVIKWHAANDYLRFAAH
jgi:diadenosine tetraphosphate (Ap4A) HIT family hydrolase